MPTPPSLAHSTTLLCLTLAPHTRCYAHPTPSPPHTTPLQRLNPDDLLGRHKYRKDKEERMKSVLEGEHVAEDDLGASDWGCCVVARCCRLAQWAQVQGGAAAGITGGWVCAPVLPLLPQRAAAGATPATSPPRTARCLQSSPARCRLPLAFPLVQAARGAIRSAPSRA